MKYRNQKFILPALFLLGIVGIFWTFLTHFGLGESRYNFLGKTKRVTLSPGAPVTQTFTARENHLHQIRFVINNTDLHRGERIELRLMDEACGKTIFQTNLHRNPSMQGVYSVFSFPAIPDSRDKRYCFAATYISDEDRKGEKPYLAATDAPDPTFADRTLTDTNKSKIYPEQTLFLRPAYTSGTLTGDLWALVERLSQYKPFFLKGSNFLILAGTFLVGTTLLAFVTATLGTKTPLSKKPRKE